MTFIAFDPNLATYKSELKPKRMDYSMVAANKYGISAKFSPEHRKSVQHDKVKKIRIQIQFQIEINSSFFLSYSLFEMKFIVKTFWYTIRKLKKLR